MAKGFPAAFVALVIGGIAAYIAWHQSKTAKAKLKLDLFDKRYEIFMETWGYLSSPIRSGEAVSPIDPKFTNLIPRALFLFGSEIEQYLKEASKKMIALYTITELRRQNGNVSRTEEIEQYQTLLEWFSNEASIGVKKRFEKFLSFENWR